ASDSFARRERRDRAMQRGDVDPAELLRARPLDGRLHDLLARKAAEEGDWQRARVRAKVATERLRGAMDGWLLLEAADHELGDDAASTAAMATALERLHEIPSDALRAYLLSRYPEPHDLAAVTPDDPVGWHRLME